MRFEDQVAATLESHDFFAAEETIFVARAPGRLDVMGGNVDYTGGFVLQGLLREAVSVAVQPRTDETIRIFNPGAAQYGWAPRLELTLSNLNDLAAIRLLCERYENADWARYVLGALYFLKSQRECGSISGADLFIASDLPPNKGVSSSAALTIATLKAASVAYGLTLEGIALAMAGQWVENVVVRAACGIMDQAAIVLGRKDHLLPLLCQPCQPFPLMELPQDICIWGIDSMAPRATSSHCYETARTAAFMGYKLLCYYEGIEPTPDTASAIPRFTDARWHGYLSNLQPSEFRSKYEHRMPEFLSGEEFLACAGNHADPFTTINSTNEYPVRSAVRYAVEENMRVRIVHGLLEAAALRDANNLLPLIGEVLCQSHVAYSECGLGSEACDELVTMALQAGLPGAKMTGGGGGGVVAMIGRAEDRDTVYAVAQEYGAGRGAMPHVFEGSSSGTDSFDVLTVQLALAQRTR